MYMYIIIYNYLYIYIYPPGLWDDITRKTRNYQNSPGQKNLRQLWIHPGILKIALAIICLPFFGGYPLVMTNSLLLKMAHLVR